MSLINTLVVVFIILLLAILIKRPTKTKDRHNKILDHLGSKRKITTIEASKLLDVSDDTALRELRKMVSEGLIKRKGVGRGVYYVKK